MKCRWINRIISASLPEFCEAAFAEGVLVTLSCSSTLDSSNEKRSQCLELEGRCKPDMGSLTLISLNFNNQSSINSPQIIRALARKMLDLSIKPELETFDIGMINYAKYLHKKGLVHPPFYFNLILGNIACAQATLLNLGLMVNELPEESIRAVGGVGDAQLKMNIIGMVNGGGVRVGLEDSIWMNRKRNRLATNTDLVKRIYIIARALEIDIATTDEVREALKLQ